MDRSRRRVALTGLASATALLVTVTGCTSSRNSTPPAPGIAPGAGAAIAGSLAGPGGFGDLGTICESGTPSGPGGRGLTNSTIRIGTIGDPGSAAAPGLEQEYFDVAKSFAKWCNAAGGINGRKIQIDSYDAKLFDGAAQIVSACQQDFMLVGNGNAFDAADVKPRLACTLGQVPALSVSPEAGLAGLQVQATSNSPTRYEVGPLRALADAYPVAKKGLGIGSSNVASLRPQGIFARQAYKSLGYTVSAVQEKPPLVDNFRPYMEQLRAAGSNAYDEIASQNPAPEVTAMHDIGWNPAFVLWNIQFYDPNSVAAAKTVVFPRSYVALGALPAELVDDYPVLQEIRSIMNAGVAKPKFTSFTGLAFSAWTLWAKSASACGANLTQDCILAKAGAYTNWTAGGLFPPHSTEPGKQLESDCFLLMRLTPDGFVYDRKVTKPNQGIYHCNPKDLVPVHS